VLGKIDSPLALGDRLADQGLTVLDVPPPRSRPSASFPELTRHDPSTG